MINKRRQQSDVKSRLFNHNNYKQTRKLTIKISFHNKTNEVMIK